MRKTHHDKIDELCKNPDDLTEKDLNIANEILKLKKEKRLQKKEGCKEEVIKKEEEDDDEDNSKKRSKSKKSLQQ